MQSKHKNPSLPFPFLVLAGAVVASLVAIWLGYRNISDGRQAAIQLAEVQTRNLALSIEKNISAILERVNDTLRSVEAFIERGLEDGPLDPIRLQRFLVTEQALLPEAVAIRVTDRNGRVIVNNPSGEPHASLADRPFWGHLRDHPEAGTFVTKPIIGKFTGRWVITSARRYNLPDGKFGGVVVAPVFVEVFHQMLQGLDVGPGGLLTLRDSGGGFVARHAEIVKGQKLAIGDRTISEELRRRLQAGEPRATFHAESPFDQTRRVITLRRLPQAPLVVLASLAEEDFLAQWRKDRTRTLLSVGLFVAGVWTVAGLQWRSWKNRERVSAALLESEAKLCAIVNNSRDAIGVSKAGVHIMVNPAYLQMFGFESAEELYETPVLDLIAPESRTLVSRYIQDRLAGNAPPPSYEVVALRRDGSTFEMEVNASEYELGGVVYTLVLLRDVTERRQAERALLASEHRFRSTLSELSEGCLILGFDWTFLFVNSTAAAHGRKPLEEFHGKKLQDVFPGVERTEIFRRYQTCMTARVPQRFEEEYRFLIIGEPQPEIQAPGSA